MSDQYIEKVLGMSFPEAYWKAMSEKERQNAPTHCGPNGSYPLGPGCAHVNAAIHLAETGHGSNPSKILRCIRSYASRNKCGGGK